MLFEVVTRKKWRPTCGVFLFEISFVLNKIKLVCFNPSEGWEAVLKKSPTISLLHGNLSNTREKNELRNKTTLERLSTLHFCVEER